MIAYTENVFVKTKPTMEAPATLKQFSSNLFAALNVVVAWEREFADAVEGRRPMLMHWSVQYFTACIPTTIWTNWGHSGFPEQSPGLNIESLNSADKPR